MDPIDIERDRDELIAVLSQPGTLDHLNAKSGDVRAFVDHELAGDPTIWTVRCEDQVIGFCSLEVLNGGWAELGVVLGSSFHRRGLATEILKATIALTMWQPGVMGAVAGVKPGNGAARRLVEALGFVHVGNVPGSRSDELAYRLSRADHAAAQVRARGTD